MKIRKLNPLLLAITASALCYTAGLCAGLKWPYFLLGPVLTTVGGIFNGLLAGRLSQREKDDAPEDWMNFECANCGDCHKPGHTCYCGCEHWRKGIRIYQPK